MASAETRLSKYLAYLLRHGGEELGLVFDAEGWTSVADVRRLLDQRGEGCSDAQFDALIAGDRTGKARFERQGNRVRARCGHSQGVPDVHYLACTPPAKLYHGTSPEAWERIQVEGLRPMSRQYVHLAVERELAELVARRHSATPIMLEIQAAEAHAAGVVFMAPDETHCLVTHLPAQFCVPVP